MGNRTGDFAQQVFHYEGAGQAPPIRNGSLNLSGNAMTIDDGSGGTFTLTGNPANLGAVKKPRDV